MMMKMIIKILTPTSGEIYNKDKVYPNNSVIITPEQNKEYMKLKAQIEKVDEVDEEVKKPEVINIMDEDNDNDQTPNNKKDKRPLRAKPNIGATRHNISDIQKLKLFKKK